MTGIPSEWSFTNSIWFKTKTVWSGLQTVLMAFPRWVSPVSRSPTSGASWWRTGSSEDRGWGSSGSTTHRVIFPRHLPASSRGVMPGQCAQNVTICLCLNDWVNFLIFRYFEAGEDKEAFTPERRRYSSEDAWRYKTSDELGSSSLSHWGLLASYSPHGFTQILQANKTASQLMMAELKRNLWTGYLLVWLLVTL